MLQAIIADDEYKVCQLLEQLGNWEELGIEVAEICNDGEEAYNAIIKKKPDIVITDIRMPVYDGLELIQKTKEQGIECEFIVISGYRQFEYAYGAIQFGVSDYLLKPIDQQQLNSALSKICKKYTVKKSQKESKERLEELKKEQAAYEEQRFLTMLMSGGFSPDFLEEYCRQYHVVLKEGLSYQAFILNTNCQKLHQPVNSFGRKVVETVKEQLPMVSFITSMDGLKGVLFLIGYEPEKEYAVTQAFSHIYSCVRALRDFYGDFDLIAAVGEPVDGPKYLADAVASAVSGEQAKLITGWNRIIFSKSLHIESRQPEEKKEEAENMKTLKNLLDCFNIEETERWFDLWMNRIQLQKNVDVSAMLNKRKEVLKLLTFCCEEEKIDDIVMQTDRARNCRDFILQLKKAAVEGIRSYLEAKGAEETKPVRAAKEYILKNFSKPLTLEEVAGHVGFSPVYFSGLFKRMTNQSFADYLTEVRLEEAKRMLKEENRSILEISQCVGYSDNKYFRKLFKKVTGMKPSDYRKLYQ